MEVAGDDGASSTTAPFVKLINDFSRAFRYYLDRSTPHPVYRWLGTVAAAAIYVLRIYSIGGFYAVSFALAMNHLVLLVGFLSPKFYPELEALDGASLPTRGSDEFKPFIRFLPEFKLRYSITKGYLVAIPMTFFFIFDIPVFWQILLVGWIGLFLLEMKRQIVHMIKYKYVPFSFGKLTYTGKNSASSRSGSTGE